MTQEDDIIKNRWHELTAYDRENETPDCNGDNNLRNKLNEVMRNIHDYHHDSLTARYFKRLGDAGSFNFLLLNLEVLGSGSHISSKLHMSDDHLAALDAAHTRRAQDRIMALTGHATVAATLAATTGPQTGLAYAAKIPALKMIRKAFHYVSSFLANATERDILEFSDKAVNILDPLLQKAQEDLATGHANVGNGNGHNGNGHSNGYARSKQTHRH